MKTRQLLVAMAMIVVSLLCSCSNEKELAWTEEVAIVNGSTITVNRKSQFKAPTELGQPPGESWYSLDFEHPTTKEEIHVEVKLRASSAEMESAAETKRLLMQWPMALMQRDNDLYLVAWSHGAFHEALHCPDPPYQLFKWVNSRWEWRPLTEIPVRQFTQSFFDDLISERGRAFLQRHDYRISAKAVREYLGDSLVEYDLSGMKQVTYEKTKFCNRNRAWRTNAPLNN